MAHWLLNHEQFITGGLFVWLLSIGKSLLDEAMKGHLKKLLKKDFIPEFIKKCLCIEITDSKKIMQNYYARRKRNKALYARQGGIRRNSMARKRHINKKINSKGV